MTTNIRQQMNLAKLNEERRKRFLQKLIEEAVINTLAEQAVQQPATTSPVMPDPTAANQPIPPTDQNPQAPGTQQEEFTLDKMIEKLNVIRGGRSFTDPEIYGQLTTMFKGWDEQSKQLIEKTFNEIAKIVTLNAADQQNGQQANLPDQTNAQPPMPMPTPAPTPPAGQPIV